MRAFVTGASGFTGRHLVASLVRSGHDTWATSLDDPGLAGACNEVLDVLDAAAVERALAQARPEWVFHLAGFSHVGRAERDPDACHELNFTGTRRVLDAARRAAPRARVIVISSAEVYGVTPVDAPARTETDPVRPATVYALSKAAAELAALHACSRGLDVVVLRPFNQIGPGQSHDFVTGAFARQVAEIEAGRASPVLHVGNLSARRDFCDVREAAAAYVRVAESGRSGEIYNVTSGVGVAVREILTTLVQLARAEVRVETDPHRLRPLDVPLLHGSGEKLARDVGVRLGLDLRATLTDVLDYWRGAIASEAPR